MRPQRKLSRRSMEQQCEAFNARHKIGDEIRVWPGARDGDTVPRIIVEPGAYVLGGHTAVVQVSRGGGCIALTHVSFTPK